MHPSTSKVTITTVAARAGVSISTVSLAINHPQRVAEATRARVLRSAAELGFRPGGGGPGRSGRLRIAVAAPFSNYPSYGRRLVGMLSVARRTAIELIVHDLDSATSADDPLLDALPVRGGVDGILLVGIPIRNSVVERLPSDAPPLVLLDVPDAPRRSLDVPLVLVDDLAGGRALGEHLASLGHRRAIFLHEPTRTTAWVSAGRLRLDGLMESLLVERMPLERPEELGERMRAILAGPGAPTAIIASHDELAALVYRALVTSGVTPGRQVALAGYDDGALAEALDLTTVRQPFEQSGRAALELLLARIADGPSPISKVTLNAELVVRGTSCPQPR